MGAIGLPDQVKILFLRQGRYPAGVLFLFPNWALAEAVKASLINQVEREGSGTCLVCGSGEGTGQSGQYCEIPVGERVPVCSQNSCSERWALRYGEPSWSHTFFRSRVTAPV